MKRILLIGILLCIASLMHAQEWYYMDHKDELLTDTKMSFWKGDYGKTLTLCDLHDSIMGRDHKDATEIAKLRTDAARCKDLAAEVEENVFSGSMLMARYAAEELQKLNPYDQRLKLVDIEVPDIPEIAPAQEQEIGEAAQVVVAPVPETVKPKEQPQEQPKEQPKPKVQPKEQPRQKETVKPVEPSVSDELDDEGYMSSYTGDDDYFPPRFVVTLGSSVFGLGQTSVAFAPGLGLGLYDIADSIMGAEVRGYLSPWLDSSNATLFGVDLCAVLRIAKGIYANAGAGFFSCSSVKGNGTASTGLCIPAGISFVLGKSFVIQAGAYYYPAIDIAKTKTVVTSAGPSYSITVGENIMSASIVPHIGIGLAF